VIRPYVIAADLGRLHDHTAVIGLRRGDNDVLEVVGIERLDLGMSYPAQVRHLAILTKQREFSGRCILAVDATGVGAAVVDLLRPAIRPTPFYGVTITGGDTATREMRDWRVPKRDLVSAAQVGLQQRRIKLPSSSALSTVLVEELMAYQVSISSGGHDTYGNDWRQAQHDDLVLALAIGIYVADHTKPRPMRTFGHLLTTTRANVKPLWT
jgi:terminase large subunit-like protein